MRVLTTVVTLLAASACAFEPSGLAVTTDAPMSTDDDGATVDAAAGDAAPPDAAATDASVVDASVVDAPPPIDARLIDAPPPIDARPIDAAPPRCVGYQAVTGAPATSRYRKVNTNTTWDNARTNCTADGGFLVVPGSAAEALAVATFVNPNTNSPYYWAGISDPERDGTWTTVLGTTQTFLPWGTGQPNARLGEIYMLVDTSGRFWDWYDNGAQEYACECVP